MFQPAPRRHRRLPSGTMVSYAEVKSYLSKREIPQLFESLMAGLMYHRPENHIGYLQSCLDQVRANETKVQWSTFVNAKKRKSKEILPPLTPKKQDSFSSWSDNSRQSTPLPPISARTRTRQSLEQQDLRNTYILYHNPPPILAKPKVPVISVLGGLGSKIDELCERVVGRLRGVVHISTCSMLKTRMTIEGFYRVTSVPACAVVDSVLQAMSMVQSENALIVAGFPRNRGDIEEYRSRRVRMDGVVLVDFEEEALRRFLEHEVQSGAVRSSEIEAELERFKQDIISVAEYYDQKDQLTVVMGDQDMEEIIDDLVLAVDKVIETRKNFVDEDVMDIQKDVECDSPDRLERPSTVEIRDATEEDIKSIEAEASKINAIEGPDVDELSKDKVESTENASKESEDDQANVKAESEMEVSTAKLEEDASNKSDITDKIQVSGETTDVKEISEAEAAIENNEETQAVEKSEEVAPENIEAVATAEKSEAEVTVEKSEKAEIEKNEVEALAEKSEEEIEKSEGEAAAENSEQAEIEKSEGEAAAEKSEETEGEKSEEVEGEKSEEVEGEKSEEAAAEKSGEVEAEKSEEAATKEGNEATVEEGEVVEKSEVETEGEKGEGKEAEKSENEPAEKSEEEISESAEGQKDPSDIELKDEKELHGRNTDDKENEKSETNGNEASGNDGDPTNDKQGSEKNMNEQLRIIAPNIPLVFAFENINVDYDEMRNLIANDLEMCFIDFHELMRNDGSNDDKFDNDETLSMLRGILKQDSVSYSNGFFVLKFPFSLLSENNVEELLKLGNVSFVCKVRENKSDSESETKEVKEEKLFHSSLSEKVRIIFVTENNIIDELKQALQGMIENKNLNKEDIDVIGEMKENADQSERSSIESKQEEDNDEEKVPDTNENDVAEGAEQEKEDESGKNGDNEEEQKSSKNEKDGDKDILEKEDVMTEDKTNQDDYEDSTGKDIEDLISDDTLNEGSKPPESLKSEENQDLIPDGEIDHTHSQASTLDDETQRERATLERQSGMEMDDAPIDDEDNTKPKLVRQSTYSAGEETNDEEKVDKVSETSQKEELSKEESNAASETKNEDEVQEGSSPKEDENINEPETENKEVENVSEVVTEQDSNKNEATGDDIVESKQVEEGAETDENIEETQPEAEKSDPEEQQSDISENKEDKLAEAEGQDENVAEEVKAEAETINEVNESSGDSNPEVEDAENSKEENSESVKEVVDTGDEEIKSEEKESLDIDNASAKEDSENPEADERLAEDENTKENETEKLSDENLELTEASAKDNTENEENENADGSNAEEEQSEKEKSETPIDVNAESKEESEAENPENNVVNDNEDKTKVDHQDSESKTEGQISNEEASKAESQGKEDKDEEKGISEKLDKGDANEEEKNTFPEIIAKQKVVDNDSDSNDENVIIETQAEVHATDSASPPAAEVERSDSKNEGNQDDEIQKSDAETAENEKTDQNINDDSSTSNKNKQNENETLHKETILQNESNALTIQHMENMGSERFSGKRQERNGSGILDESREQDQRESEEPQERSSSSSRGEL